MDGFPDLTAAKAMLAQQPRKRDDPPEIPAILSAAEFMDGFEPPDYVIDGIIQRGRLYALTSPTGHGKTAVALYMGCMVAEGRDLGNIDVMQGDAVILAGENPEDLRCRLYAACQAYRIKSDKLRVHVLPGHFPMTAGAAEALKIEIDKLGCAPVLVIIDTAAAFFQGDDENSNVQMGTYARNLRLLTTCKGTPAVLAPAHPVKAPDKDNLLPRGGGGFLNELDGNLTLWAQAMGESATLHWQGKIRGADFAPVNFRLQQIRIDDLTDRKGRPIMSIVAALQTDDEAESAANQAMSDENTVLVLLGRDPGISLAAIARNAGWVSAPSGPDKTTTPNKAKVHRLLKTLKTEKLVTQHRGKWQLTDGGKKRTGGG